MYINIADVYNTVLQGSSGRLKPTEENRLRCKTVSPRFDGRTTRKDGRAGSRARLGLVGGLAIEFLPPFVRSQWAVATG